MQLCVYERWLRVVREEAFIFFSRNQLIPKEIVLSFNIIISFKQLTSLALGNDLFKINRMKAFFKI